MDGKLGTVELRSQVGNESLKSSKYQPRTDFGTISPN
jgi:hypothetical protein